MANKTITFLRGSVRVRVESAWPERIFNLCAARGIALHEPVWHSATELSFSVDRRDYRALRQALESLGAEMTPEKKAGMPYLLHAMRRRYALFAGAGMLAILLLVNSFFIWDFSVSGNETVTAGEILHVLAKNGVHRGTCIYSYRSQDICNRALLELPELAWLTVNVRGCRAYVQVKERVRAPQPTEKKSAGNVVAKRDALVTKVQALDGEKKVLPGTVVREGQLLISGVVETEGVENPSVALRMLAGRGTVWGRTWYELSTTVPLQTACKCYTGKEKTSVALLWGGKRMKFPQKDSSISDINCDKIICQKKQALASVFALPLSWEVERLFPYETLTLTRTREEAEEIGEKTLEDYLTALLGADGSITAMRFAAAQQGDAILVTLSAECLESIGESVPVSIDEG